MLLAHEHGFLGQRQMHPGALDRPDTGDRAGQFPLQGMLIAGILHELTDTEAVLLIQKIEAVHCPARQSLARELQAHGMDVISRNGQRTGA